MHGWGQDVTIPLELPHGPSGLTAKTRGWRFSGPMDENSSPERQISIAEPEVSAIQVSLFQGR